MKKLIALFLSVMMILTSFSFVAADDGEIIFTFTVSGGNATITGASSIPADITEFIIPTTVSDAGGTYTVTAIADSAFNGNTNVKGELTIPGTVQSIGASAFKGVKYLTGINIQDGVKTIGASAFEGVVTGSTSPLKYISVPPSVTTIGNAAFKANENTMYLELAEGFTTVPAEMFRSMGNGNKGWTHTVIPSTVNTIYTSTFEWTRNLEHVYVLSTSLTLEGRDFDVADETNPLSKGMGSQSGEGQGAVIHVVNEAVKNAFIEKNYPAANADGKVLIEVMPYNTAIFNDTFTSPTLVADDDADGWIEVPEPATRTGYRFLYWKLDGAKFYPGQTMSISKSVSVTGAWEKEREADNVIYKNISSGLAVNTFTPATVDKMICESLRTQEVTVKLTDTNDVVHTVSAFFDTNGIWKNTIDTTLYKKVEMPAAYSDLCILTKVDGEQSFEITLRNPKVLIAPRIDAVDSLDEIEWTSSNEKIATVENGVVTGHSSGTATITAKVGDSTYTYSLEAFGELALAQKNNTVDAYLTEKAPIFNAINTAINANDKSALAGVLKSDGAIKLSDIQDIDMAAVPTDATQREDLAERIISYGELPFANDTDVENFFDILTNEIIVGRANDLADITAVENALKANNAYYGLALDNQYYLKYKDEVLGKFVNYKAENLKGLQDDFIEKYVMTAVLNVARDSGYSVLQQTVNNCATEIGYNTTHYAQVNNTTFHQTLLTAISNGSITTIAQLKNYIDTAPVQTPGGGLGGGGGAGGGGGGGAGTNIGNGVSNTTGNKGYGDITTSIVDHEHEDLANNPLPEDKSSVFGDVDTQRWSYESIKYLVAKQIISGYEDGSFRPENKITRAEFIKILVAAFGFSVTAEEEPAEETAEETEAVEEQKQFTDVNKTDWYYPSVAAAFENGIVLGDANGAFNPNTEISRQEMATMVYRAIVSSGKNIPIEKSFELADKDSINDWAYMAVTQLVNMGIINGYDDGSFRPFAQASREEVAKLVYGVMLKLAN